MKTKIQIKSVFGTLLFEHECEDNSIRKTLEAAVEAYANLTYADLTYANLTYADLTRATLSGADLTYANLTYADLTYADITRANLAGATLSGANLTYADLTYADLTRANLADANLTHANLTYADLTYADLTYADLAGANLTHANLTRANLTHANLAGAKNADYAIAQTVLTPEGTLIGWKKCRDNIIVKLRIPEEAKRSNTTGRKCRAEFADVLEIIDLTDNHKQPSEAVSMHDGKTTYRVGERVTCDKWEDNRWEECAGGIHFYITRVEAENHE